MDVEDLTLENFSNIFRSIMSYNFFDSLLFLHFGFNIRALLDFLFFITSLTMATCFVSIHILTLLQNFADAMIQVALIFHSLCLIVRIVTVFIYREDIVALTSVNFREFNSNQKRPNSSLNILKESYVFLKKLDKFMKGYFILFLGCWYVIPAIFSNAFLGLLEGRNNIEDVLIRLPTTFPGDGISTKTHMLSWTFHIVYGVVFVSIWATVDVLCFAVTIVLKRQYRILSDSLSWNHGTSKDCAEPLKLREFVQDHVKLMRMTNMLRDILGPIVGAQMMQTIFITACSTFIAAMPTADSGDQFTGNFVAYSFMSLLELFAFCWQSYMVNKANERLGFVIYLFSLHEPLNKSNKDWYLPLLMSQKTIKYTALGLVEINMETFLGVLRASYSYYTLMQAKT